MTDEEFQQLLRLQKIFMPHSMKQREEAYARQGVEPFGSPGLKFAHYTSAEAALSILRSKRIWMRNATCMSDYREVQHGFEMLQRYFDPVRTREFADILDLCAPGSAMEAINAFNKWWSNKLALNVHVASLSEHNAKEEDRHGRLSMWRAFGANPTRVAIVITIPNHPKGSEALSIVFSPVAYLTEDEMRQQVRDVAENAKRETDFLKTVGRQTVVAHLFMMLFAGVTCLKHEGFREEREWRAVYNHNIFPSPLMERSLENFAGVPQHVFRLPLDETVSADLADLDLTRMLDRVIIGPSPYPWVLYQAFVEVLQNAGVADAENRVWVSGIPIRH